jgi:UDP-N-acetylglucosamine transferase subunit ALG13
MILVTVGTNEARFDRLLRAVAGLSVAEPFVVQHGHSAAVGPSGATLVDFLPFDELVEHVRQARVVVTHAGVGSIMVALANGKRPVVVPRRKLHGEAVDDHQLQLGRRFGGVGLVTFVEEPDGLAAALARVDEGVALPRTNGELGADLGRFLHATINGVAPTGS